LEYLTTQKHSGNLSLRKFNRINILLLLHKGKKTSEIADFLDVDRITIWRTKSKFQKYGVEQALEEADRPGQPVK